MDGDSRTDWSDDNPYYLVLVPDDAAAIAIDLGERGWAQTYAGLMRQSGVWMLCRKGGAGAVLVVMVHRGEQPYYTARHIGAAGSGGSNELTAYGIGKKRVDGSMVRLWIMPNGALCGGDDVDDLGVRMVNAMGPR